MLLPYNTTKLGELTRELDAWGQRLDYRTPLPRTWLGRIRRELEAEAIAASTSMEGVPVTIEEVRRILAGEKPSEVSDQDRALVEGYRDAMAFVLRRADDPSFTWNRELIVALHDRVLAGRFGDGAGRLRTGPTKVARRDTGEQVFAPPQPEEVPDLVDEACGRMEQASDHPAVMSAWLHVAIAAIHPFRDGNGRAARVLASLAMYRGGFKRPEFTSLEEWWGRNLQIYYGSFACLGDAFDRNADVTPFVEAHMTAHLHQIRALDARERTQQQVWTALEEVAEDRGLNTRVANALWDAFFGRFITAGYYRGLSDVSPATATNDLAAAVSARLLQAQGERRGRRYMAGSSLYREVGGALFIDPIPEDAEAARGAIVTELATRLTSTGEAFGFPRRPFSEEN
ncbi:MAG: Fic family protein [Actinomycetota bacterium]